MVNKSSNINKTKDSLKGDSQQFHQYQQNKECLNNAGVQFEQYQLIKTV